ncbi:hypothetical protein BC832DRAFT_543587 [Gaertneriomyces semiglobifer]|nr:hypothetical protein BC832DRAFT_543587 [Gaertneriomyces semiglobifer]
MRLITHNMLQCHAKGCNSNNYPLELREVELESLEAEFSDDFIRRLLPKLDWGVLVQTAYSLGVAQLPEEVPEEQDEDFLRVVHDVILGTRVKVATMICKGCGHVYPIKDGVPNMLLQDNEV